MRFSGGRCTLILVLSLLAGGCHSEHSSETSPKSPTISPAWKRGKTVYQTHCIACHNPDPHKPGTLGPEVFGSSQELIELRVLQAKYPEGYKPKRQTHTMAPLPHLKDEIKALTEYLN